MTTRIHPTLDVESALTAIDNIHDLLQAEAEDSERLRRPTPAVQKALKESGVFELLPLL